MIVGTFTKIPKAPRSHSYGWAKVWSENLGVPLDHDNQAHKKVYLLHGANFGGSLNFFGGFTEEIEKSVNNLMEADEIVSLDIDMPQYGEMLRKRNDVKDKGWCDALTEKLAGSSTLISSDLPLCSIAVGDSHTAAYSPSGSAVVKQDGTTLNGQIQSKFEYIKAHIKPHHKTVTISLGNIDVRHHIVRLGLSADQIGNMVSKLAYFCKSLDQEVEVSAPWPIEFEGRKLPKTGYYKDKPFWGTRHERSTAANLIRMEMLNHGLNVVDPPAEWFNADPEYYANTFMEAKQSVHLSPQYYRRWNWGMPENDLTSFF